MGHNEMDTFTSNFKERQVAKGRQSGMPEEGCWDSCFNADCVLSKLDFNDQRADVLEYGCGYGTFTEAAAQRTTGTLIAA